MSYVTNTTTAHGRTEPQMDLAAFTADLARALKAQPVAPTRDDFPSNERKIQIDAATVIGLYWQGPWKRRLSIRIWATDVPHGDRNFYDKEQKLTEVTIDPDARAIDRIAADIKRRLIDANAPALAKQRAHAKQKAEDRDTMARTVADFRARFPNLDVRHEPREQRAQIYSGSSGHYVSAVLHHPGSVSIERLGSMTLDQFAAVLQILSKPCVE